jgi:hypothetical protein
MFFAVACNAQQWQHYCLIVRNRHSILKLNQKPILAQEATMATKSKVRGDKLVIAMLSVMRTLIIELDKAGAVDLHALLSAIDDTAALHRQHGDPNQLADAIEAIAAHLRDSSAASFRSDQ